jgi:hypothetical protein
VKNDKGRACIGWDVTRASRLLILRVAIIVVIVVAALAVVPRQRLIIAAQADRTGYVSGELVTITVVLAVGASEPVSIQSPCIPYQLGFTVADERGDVVYTSFNPSEIYSCLRSNPVATLQPGWTESRSLTWYQFATSGSRVAAEHTYTVLPVLFGTPSVAPVTAASQIFIS